MSSDVTIHPTAIVDSEIVGSGTRIWEFTNVMKGASIGSGCNIGGSCFIEEGVTIGDNVVIKNGVSIWKGVTIEDNAFIGPGVVFTNETEPRALHPKEVAETLICKGASLGAGSILVAPVIINEYALVGAGTVVTRDVKSHQLVVGNPAKPSGVVCVCGRKVSDLDVDIESGSCECGREFSVNRNVFSAE